jgi:hypothetical protein
MNTHELFIHPILEIYATTPMPNDISGIIANINQKIKFAEADGSQEAKQRIKNEFNALLKQISPQDKQKYYRQLLDYKNRITELMKAQSTQAHDPRIDHETIQNQEDKGKPLSFTNFLARKAAK